MIVRQPKLGRRVGAAVCAALAAGFLFVVAGEARAAVLQCVQYARSITNVPLKGDAWTWWNKAPAVRLARGQEPEMGAILVLRKPRSSHVAMSPSCPR